MRVSVNGSEALISLSEGFDDAGVAFELYRNEIYDELVDSVEIVTEEGDTVWFENVDLDDERSELEGDMELARELEGTWRE